MSKFQGHAKYVLFSLAIIIFSIGFSILNSKVKTHSLTPEEPFIITFGEDLSIGDYYLEYYIACSSSDNTTSSMVYSLKSISADGAEVLLDKQRYSKAIGYGISSFRINNNGDTVTAEFKRPENKGLFSRFSGSAGVGNIYVSSKDGTYRNAIYIPDGIGKQAEPIEYESNPSSDISLSDFATFKGYSMNGKTLDLTFICTEETPIKYELGLEITCNNINLLPSTGVRQSFYSFAPDTDAWVAGEEYVQHINLGLAPGTYWIDMAVSIVSPDTPRNISNYILKDNQSKIPLGSIDISGQYLSDFLHDIDDGQIVIVSMMDEGTRMLNEMSRAKLNELGLKADLIGKNRWSYIGIAAKGVENFEPIEKLSQELIEINLPKGNKLGMFELPFDLSVISAGYAVGNTSSITIDQKEYSPKKRGMNIVVYDVGKGEVISSVNFDTYMASYN